MTIRSLTLLACAIAAICAVAPAAVAGGWALTTLDTMPAPPRAGEPVEIGYTIRQHGITPVDLDDTAIAIRANSGDLTVFAGRRAGPTGHYVAKVTFPQAGRWTWSARMGWFGEQALGGVDVSPAPSASGAPGRGSEAGWLLLAGALVGAAFAAGGRRRPARPATA